MRGELTRGKVMVVLGAAAVACGAAAGLLLGPVWTIAGVLLGPLVGSLILAVVYVVANPDAAALLSNDRPDAAIAQLRYEMSSWRALARIWPSQFRETLASRLIVQSGALQAVHRDEEALRTADEAVAIYQDLAAERPGKYGPDLADALDHQSRLLAADDRQAEALAAIRVAVRLYRNLAAAEPATCLPLLAECLTCEADWLAEIDLPGEALTAVHEATGICQDKLPWQQLPSCAARAMFLEGELLCGRGRHRQAVRLLAQGWRLAADQEDVRREDVRREDVRREDVRREDVRRDAGPAIRAAYLADPDHFAAVWQAETGAEPPDWLTT
jgi:tetratricopeptide (TPR) repeat protein